ncbi:MAG: polynucleotide adenylyltransferase PcnB, partial [Psychrobacter sp.]
DTEHSSRVRSNSKQQNKTAPSEENSSPTKANITRSIARSPALVSMNNEPIPYKRRRREPTVELASNDESVEIPTVEKAPKVAKTYAKKVPKSTDSSTDTAVSDAKKPTQAVKRKSASSKAGSSQAISGVLSNDKGPVPSKRRRRQPSTENV